MKNLLRSQNYFSQIQKQTLFQKLAPNDPSPYPPFHMVDEEFACYTGKITKSMHTRSPWRWTPLIQKQQQSEEFLKKMRYFQKLKIFEKHHTGELIDCVLFEALKGTDFDYYYDYHCKSTPQCSHHGISDFMIYNKNSLNKLPLIPVLKVDKITQKTLLIKEVELNMGPSLAAVQWAVKNMNVMQKDIRQARLIQTDGNHWRLIQLGIDSTFEKTCFYTPNNEFQKLYLDYDMQQVVLGLVNYLRFSLNQFEQNEMVLKQVYDFVDERRYLTEITQEDRDIFKQQRRFWSFLPKAIVNFFFPNRY